MQRYKNLSGDSGVVSYELGPGAIAVEFSNGDVYVYTNRSAGKSNIAQMQKLAQEGCGLSTFISQNVHDRFEQKLT
jgi:hypothetical protein